MLNIKLDPLSIDLSAGVSPQKFAICENLILSGQIPEYRITELLRDNPKFSKWWKRRSDYHYGSK
jgi:hypothetical protein